MTPLSAACCCATVRPLDMMAVAGSVELHTGLLGWPVTEFSKFCCGTTVEEGTLPLVASAIAYRIAYSTIHVCEETVNSLKAGSLLAIDRKSQPSEFPSSVAMTGICLPAFWNCGKEAARAVPKSLTTASILGYLDSSDATTCC